MSVTIAPLRLSGFDSLPKDARRCVFWEVDPGTVGPDGLTDAEFEKEAWLSMVMLEWGSCAQVAFSRVDGMDRMVGWAFYAPPRSVPRSALFPTSPVSADAVLLSCVSVEPGLDRAVAEDLVVAVCEDLMRRGVRAVEAFGLADGAVPPSECELCQCDTSPLVQASLLEQVGFQVVAPHHRYPRLRYELTEGLGWKAGVEHALEQLLAASLADATLTSSGAVPAGC
ncbi:acetyltransferase [Tsukamurella sp. 8F]|uniref:acetyltransferase n=1 Tax=unclassified Tsukamurella TaxID=2633480 RepID=UPI0023B92EB2|nr:MULTISPECIES: acetyltransferase [unclassified Tsukamurella]MDF0529411.1 acetyltransferase [Tsukamurella sp. 8J]MDF0587082.1 acetyltransferase [Tsukamurella sp. 8F]